MVIVSNYDEVFWVTSVVDKRFGVARIPIKTNEKK
jgi:hypothetical protein